MDGYRSHCTVDFIAYCEQHKIVPFCLRPHSTQLLQPLDVVLFYSCKKAHRDVPNEAMRSCSTNFNKIEFLYALKGMNERAFRDTSIGSSFRRNEIYPLNPGIVPDQLPSDRPVTPEPPTQEQSSEATDGNTPSTPMSCRALKRYADKLHDTEMPAPVRQLLTPFLKGAVALATAEDLAYEQLAIHTDAQHERAKRQKKTQ